MIEVCGHELVMGKVTVQAGQSDRGEREAPWRWGAGVGPGAAGLLAGETGCWVLGQMLQA